MTLTILHSGGTRRDHCGAAGQWQLRAAGAAPGRGRARWGFFPGFWNDTWGFHREKWGFQMNYPLVN